MASSPDQSESPQQQQKDDNDDSEKPFVTIHKTPIYFDEDWNVGIGGGLWTTGAAWMQYIQSHHALLRRNLRRSTPLRVLELGSGNGLLAVCLVAIDASLFETIVITDFADHLPLIQHTVDRNAQHLPAHKFVVQVHEWGKFDGDAPQGTYDVIIGSDVAYRDELHDPLIASLVQFANADTIILLGATMHDTRPIFFRKLHQNGFQYERIADHHLPIPFRGMSFGLFVIQKREQKSA